MAVITIPYTPGSTLTTISKWLYRFLVLWAGSLAAIQVFDSLFPIVRFFWDYFRIKAVTNHHPLASIFVMVDHATWTAVMAFLARTWIVVETCFYFYYLMAQEQLQPIKKPSRQMSKGERTALYWQCVTTVQNCEEWACGWFYYRHDLSRPTFDQIRRDTLCRWFAWAFWQEDLKVVRQTPSWADELEWMVDSVEKYYNVHFLPGDNNQLQCIRLNLDPVLSVHRPLAVYLAIFFCTKIFNGLCMSFFWRFRAYGNDSAVWGGPLLHAHQVWDNTMAGLHQWMFGPPDPPQQTPPSVKSSAAKPPTLHYWYRPAKPDTTATPLVFIHGIGAGLMCYAEWVFHLTRMDRPIYCVELPFVSMHMVDHVPDADDFVDAIQHMLHTHGHHHAVFVGHSLGTAVTSWVMTRLPQLVAGTVLIDPICFLLHYPNVCFNFIYRAPRQWIDYLMLYVASRELYISHYIARHFQWFQCIYFANRLNGDLTLNQTSPLKRATVYLSTEDSLVPSAMVAKYLIHQRVDCRTMPGLTHAGFLFNWTWRKRILRQIEHIATDVDLEGTDLCMAS